MVSKWFFEILDIFKVDIVNDYLWWDGSESWFETRRDLPTRLDN